MPIATTNVVLDLYPHAQFTSIVNPTTSYTVYERYRQFAMGLLDTSCPQLFYKSFCNEAGSFNGEAIHEKFIYQGRAVLDLSLGLLDFPWYAADSLPSNEKTVLELQQIANLEADLNIAPKLRAIANFVATLPPYTRVYYYSGIDGLKSVTVSDQFNGVKFNYELTYLPLSITF